MVSNEGVRRHGHLEQVNAALNGPRRLDLEFAINLKTAKTLGRR
jgi:hypothetical protein